MTGLGPPTGVTHLEPAVGTDGAVVPLPGPRTTVDAAALRLPGGRLQRPARSHGTPVVTGSWAALAPEPATAVRRRPTTPVRISAERR
jgi:hypothetical protein